MSDRPELDLRAEITRIDRDRTETTKLLAESQKFLAEQDRDRAETNKLLAESRKLLAEQAKFVAEENKTWRDWRLAPWLAWLGIAGGAITLIGAIVRVFVR